MPRVPGVRVPFIEPSAIDRLAGVVRAQLAPNVPADGMLDMVRVLESVDGRRMRLPNGTLATVKLDVATLPSHVMAETKVVDDRIYLTMAASTYNLLCCEEGFARFTAAHEIGHVNMHLQALAELERVGHHQAALARATSHHKAVIDSEFQANIFAAAFLAPDQGLKILAHRDKLTVEDVMNTFGMGRKAATARIDNYRRRGGAQPWRHTGGR